MEKIKWMQVAQSHNVEYPGLTASINGHAGELEFAQWLQEFGLDSWRIYRNLWLHKGNTAELDFLIVSRAKWIMIEVKNYEGLVTLGEKQTSIGDLVLDRNPIEQVQRSIGVLRRITALLPSKPQTEAALVFINTHCHIVKTDACFGIPVYGKSQLKSFIQQLVKDTRSSFYSQKALSQIDDLLDHHRVDNPYGQIKLEDCDFSKVYQGFTCGKCSGREVKLSHRHLHCKDCGHLELKRQALVRKVEDYCLLYQREEFTRHEIFEFIGGKMSLHSIGRILHNELQFKKGYKAKYFSSNRKANSLIN